MEPVYRTADAADAVQIRALAEEAWIPTYRSILSEEQLRFMFEEWYSPSGIVRSMEQGQTFVLCVCDATPVGYAAYSLQQGNTAKLNKIYLLPSAKGLGLGRKFLEEIESRVQVMGVHTLLLNVNRYNPAVHFYEACGYRILREEDIPIGDFWMNDYVMGKTWE